MPKPTIQLQDPAGNGTNTPSSDRLKNLNDIVTNAQTGKVDVQPHVFDRLVKAHNQGDTKRAHTIAAGVRAAQVDAETPGAKPLTAREKIRTRK